jgi:hypothetical protein
LFGLKGFSFRASDTKDISISHVCGYVNFLFLQIVTQFFSGTIYGQKKAGKRAAARFPASQINPCLPASKWGV